jgi:hypothetical protein
LTLSLSLFARDQSDDAKWRDVVALIRADEAHHREVNHTFANLQLEQDNPFPPGH